jgi:hypothetical protein
MRLHVETIYKSVICGDCVRIGILRGGDNFERFGDDFTFSGVAIIKNSTLRIKGMIGKMSKTFRSDIKKLMRTNQLKKITWTRIKGNKVNINTKILR